jgi:hypothetical protein
MSRATIHSHILMSARHSCFVQSPELTEEGNVLAPNLKRYFSDRSAFSIQGGFWRSRNACMPA